MAHGLEARSPFMDHTVAEYMARVPVKYKVRGRNLRYLQKRLAQKYLPDKLLRFPKQGFSSPLPYLLKEEYAKLFSVFLTEPRLAQDELINQGKVQELLSQHLGKKADHGNRLWLLLNAEVWYRMLIDGSSRDDMNDMLAVSG